MLPSRLRFLNDQGKGIFEGRTPSQKLHCKFLLPPDEYIGEVIAPFTESLWSLFILLCVCALEHDASVAYVDDDDDDDPSLPLYQTMPYVCGKVLLASVLDSLVAAVSACRLS